MFLIDNDFRKLSSSIKYIVHYFFGGSMAVNLDTLPIEILPLILRDLSPGQLSSFTACRYLYEVASSDELWKQLCLARKITPLEGRSFKEAFLEYSKGYYRFIEIALREEDVNPNNVPLKKDEIDQRLKEAENLPALLKKAVVEEKSALEVRYLIEAGAFKRSVDKETLLKLALTHHYPCDVIELLVEQGAAVSQEILSAAFFMHLDPDCLRVLLIQILKNEGKFSKKILKNAIGARLPEKLILFIIDHCEITHVYLKHALLLKSPDSVITRLSGTRGEFLSLNLLDYFFKRSDLFFRLYLKSIHPITTRFIDKAISKFLLEDITFETFSKIVETMRMAGVRFSKSQIEALNVSKSPFRFEALQCAIAQSETTPYFLVQRCCCDPDGAIELKRYLDMGVQITLDTLLGTMFFPLGREVVHLLAPYMDLSALEKKWNDDFTPFFEMLTKISEEYELNEEEVILINESVLMFFKLLAQIKQGKELSLVEKYYFCRTLIQKTISTYFNFYEALLLNGNKAYPNLSILFQNVFAFEELQFLHTAILLKRPPIVITSLLKAGGKIDFTDISLAIHMQYEPGTIELLINALDKVDGIKEVTSLRGLRILLSPEHLLLVIKKCSSIPDDFFTDCIIDPQDINTLKALVQAGVQTSYNVLKFAITANISADLFEMLLKAANRTVSLEKLLRYAQKPHLQREEIVHLIEERMHGNLL